MRLHWLFGLQLPEVLTTFWPENEKERRKGASLSFLVASFSWTAGDSCLLCVLLGIRCTTRATAREAIRE